MGHLLARAFAAVLMSALVAGSIGFAQVERGVDEPRGERETRKMHESAVLLNRRGRLAPAERAKVPLLVDRTIRLLEVSVHVAAGGSSVLRRPGGQVAADRGAGVTITRTTSGEVIEVHRPEVGTWQLELAGAGDYSVSARASSPVQFDEFAFMRLLEQDPEGHNTWALIHGVTHVALSGELVAGIGEPEAQGVATVLGDGVVDPIFTLESELGEVLGKLDLKPDESGAFEDGYGGRVPVPAVPFKVVVSGTLAGVDAEDSTGARYRREFPTVFRARSVGVEAATGPMHIPVAAGQKPALRYLVRNRGSSGTFEMSAQDELGFVTGVTPRTVSIPAGETRTVTVTLALSADALAKAEANSDVEPQNVVTLVAKRPGDDRAQNSGAITLVIVPEDEMTEVRRQLTE